MQTYRDVVANNQGVPVPGASILVKLLPSPFASLNDGTLATLYDGVGNPIANPITSVDGSFSFAAANGKYALTVSVNGLLAGVVGPVALFDPADAVAAGQIGTSGGSTVQAKLDANSSAIASNTSNIASNTSAISANTSAITANSADLSALQLADYTALRAYAGARKSVYVTGIGIAGMFVRDDADATTADNGGTVIVAGAVRWKRIYTGHVDHKWFGAKANGTNDDTAANQAAANAAVGGTLLITGVTGISSPLEIKNGVNVMCLGEIKALAGFTGSQLVITDQSASYNKGTLSKLRLNGNGLNIKGLVVRSAQTSFVTDIYVYGCLNDGIHVQGGYEVFISNWQVLGAASGMTANAAGLRATAGDCHYTDGVATLYPIGVAAEGGNSHFTRIHPWGVYTAGSTPMLHGFLITGEGNTLTDCSPDSPDLANRTIAVSKANGGYGFYADAGAINTKFVNCKLIVASNANAPAAKLYFGYVGAAYCGFVNCNVDDNSGAAMAGNIQYVSVTTQRTTEFFGGSLSAGGLWMNGIYGTFTPELRFGGVEISTLGGAYFSGRRSGYYFRIGPMIYFAIHIRITAKGTSTGAVTVGGLPFSYVDFGNSQAWPLNGQMVNPAKNTLARIFVNSSELRIYDAGTGNQLADTDIGVNQEIYISGMYPVTTAP